LVHKIITITKTRPKFKIISRVLRLIISSIFTFASSASSTGFLAFVAKRFHKEIFKMQNDEGQITELYIPRKWYKL
jgi:Na+-driven multidrug efflux pump